jgi:carbon storage regulator
LGITAPTHIPVHRKEVYDAIKRENEQAARMSPGEVAAVTDSKRTNKDSPKKK